MFWYVISTQSDTETGLSYTVIHIYTTEINIRKHIFNKGQYSPGWFWRRDFGCIKQMKHRNIPLTKPIGTQY